MTTRRGSQYSIQSDGGALRSRNNTSKGKRKRNNPVEQNPHKEVPYPKGKSQKCLNYEPEVELSMGNSNRYKSHSEGSDRRLHGSDELLEHPEKVPQKGGNNEILQQMESTIIQSSN
ncbi:hypothetical protein O181_050929 [Austropuccinia psidii MF-1]|uniref:Uncharacterized protein n=1 Tax=Austropuccinia psidii MF-1 TaxID=1389203 RepID=A0A9Q3DXR8_9BASI|nr:hypothetical protein [Austropuccinia psidii MF-1]